MLLELIFIAWIIVPFLASLGFSMQQILITETFFAISTIIFEIPSGYFADVYGRKVSIAVGSIILTVAIAFYAFSSAYFLFIIGAILWGIGGSFYSGADAALLYESLLQLGREKEYKRISGDIMFYSRIAGIIGSITSGFLAAIFLRLPAIVNIVPIFLCFLLSLTLIETKHDREEHETWGHLITIVKESVLHNKVLGYFIMFSSIIGFFSLEFWLKQKYWEFIGIPIYYFGIIFAVCGLASGLSSKYAIEIEKFLGPKLSLIIIPTLPATVMLIYSFTESLWVLPLFVVVPAMWGFSNPVFNDFVNKLTTSNRRATVLSIMNFFRRGIYVVFAPFIGWITDVYSVQTAFLASSIIAFVVGGVGLLLLRKVKVI